MTMIRPALFVIVVGGLLFALAGRWDLPFFWAILLLFGAYVVAVSSLLDPEHGRQRTRPMAGGPDRALRAALGVLLLLHLAVAALDVGRFGWSDTVPLALRVTGGDPQCDHVSGFGFLVTRPFFQNDDFCAARCPSECGYDTGYWEEASGCCICIAV